MAANAADSSPAPGAVIAGHRITGALWRDGSGAAFRALAPDGAPVVLRVRRAGDGASRARFQAHAEMLGGLSHPALPRVTGFGEAPEGLWVATAAVEGTSLRGLLAEGISPMRAVRLLGEVADGIDAAHAAGLVHGDVRPENIIVQGRPVERAMLVGFDPETPEADPGADVLGLAGVLRECFAASDAELPLAVRAPLARGLEPDPAKRFTNAGEMIGDIARAFLVAAPRPAPAAAAEDEPKPPRRWPGRLLRVTAAVLVVLAAGGAGYAVSRDSAPDEPEGPGRAAAGELIIAVPAGWKPSATRDGVPRLRDGLTLRRRDPAGRIVAGVAADRGAVLDPSRLAAEVGADPPRPDRVRLGSVTALRFDGLKGRGPSELYVASTSDGAAAVACSGSAVTEPCAEAATGLSLRGARVFDPAAGIAWKNRVAATARRFRARRAAGLRRLRRARTPGAQAAAANRIARVHASTARRVRRTDEPPQASGARRRVLARLLAADRAYRSLARAARGSDEAAFRRALRRIRRADRRLRVTLRSL